LKKYGERLKKIILSLFVTFLFLIPAANACKNPVFIAEEGSNISPFGGLLLIDGSKYSGQVAQYGLKVQNYNDDGLFVKLIPDNDLKNFIPEKAVFVEANSIADMPLDVWIDGLERHGKLEVEYSCESSGTPVGLGLNLDTYIYNTNHHNPPPTSSCSSSGNSGCYDGVYREYYCSNNQLQYIPRCTNYCCQSYAQSTGYEKEQGFCSVDNQYCITPSFTFPPATEGKIAFLCQKDSCDRKIESTIIFYLKLKGWDVVGKSYKIWTADELNNYDIIACSDESQACKPAFNSIIYNAHFENGKPFLEISDSPKAIAAYSFNYLKGSSGSLPRKQLFITKDDTITSGFTGEVSVVRGDKSTLSSIRDSYLTSDVIDLADAGNSSGSDLFKVNCAVDHGKYAYLGFFSGGFSGLTVNGELIMNRTLKWLKEGCANQNKIGDIAFICSRDQCTSQNEMDLIKLFRKTGYSVTGKSLKTWTEGELNSYDLIVCSSSTTCRFKEGTAPYNSHMFANVGFLEIPDSVKPNAAYLFGYSTTTSTRTKTDVGIYPTSDSINSGLGNKINVFTSKKPIYGVNSTKLNAIDVANNDQTSGLSTIFKKDTSGTEGRYAFVGFLGRNFKYLTDDGKIMLQRTVNWVKCGSISC
jgi:hypothetical protein